jgi:curved DNA-binding protein CbpA
MWLPLRRRLRPYRGAALARRITWYDILGIEPGASAETVRRACQDRGRQLEDERMAGAPEAVADAVERGWQVLRAAWLVLGDRAERERYDEEIGAGREGAGRAGRGAAASRARPGPAGTTTGVGVLDSAGVREGLGALADWLAPVPRKSRRRPRQVTAPDVRGLFIGPCHDALARAGLRVRATRLTADPMPVEGLVVGQSPAPGERMPLPGTLTVQVWHPPRSRPHDPAP